MGPKPAAPKISKNEVKKKEKVVEDRTFGLKNKKGAQTQKYIQQVQKNAMANIQAQKGKPAGPSKKEEKKKFADELAELFKPVQAMQKVEFGVNPKSVLCVNFKAGNCIRGDRCKFSHDVKVANKSGTKNYYADTEEEKKKDDNTDDWDEEKLREVVDKKHGASNKAKPQTDIICKYFLEALENSKYGWFWDCPNGNDKCHYRHVLPPGYVLKKDQKKDKKEEISIEELVERERQALGYDLPKINLQSFLAWKKQQIADRRARDKEIADKKKSDLKQGKQVALSGREMFTFKPEMMLNEGIEDGEGVFDNKTREDLDGDEIKAVELDLEKLALEAKESDGTGTVVDRQRPEKQPAPSSSSKSPPDAAINEDLFADDDLDDLDDELEDDDDD